MARLERHLNEIPLTKLSKIEHPRTRILNVLHTVGFGVAGTQHLNKKLNSPIDIFKLFEGEIAQTLRKRQVLLIDPRSYLRALKAPKYNNIKIYYQKNEDFWYMFV